jgi:putative transposase
MFGGTFAQKLGQHRPKPGDIWHLDEVLILSEKSGCWRQSCETSDARHGRWQAIEPSYYP